MSYTTEFESAARKEKNPLADPQAAAWASFCEALLGAAEFRYLR